MAAATWPERDTLRICSSRVHRPFARHIVAQSKRSSDKDTKDTFADAHTRRIRTAGDMTHLIALPGGTELAGDYKIASVLGAGGFGVTYLAEELALSRLVSIKEYFPTDFAARSDGGAAAPRSQDCSSDYKWGLERFIEEAQTLAKFDHANIVRVYRTFRANNTAYMVLHFEEGQSLKAWLKGLGRAPRQKELDAILAPLLDALETIHKADFLHRDIAPDNIIIRKAGDPVLIDFGAARGDIAAHSKTKTVSALVKPGYSPYEQYAETSRQQGPWTDIYALAATLYHAVTGKRPPDSPSRMLKDDMIPAREAALSSYRATFLDAIQRGLALGIDARPQSVAAWRGALLAPEPEKSGMLARLRERTEVRRSQDKAERDAKASPVNAPVPPPPDAPGPQGGLLDFVDALKNPALKIPAPKLAAVDAVKPGKAKIPALPAAPGAAAKPANAIAHAPAKPDQTKKIAAKKRLRPAPDVARNRPLTRGLRTKVMIAAALTGAVVAFQDQIQRVLTVPANGITTGAIVAPPVERTIAQSAEFKAHDGAIEQLSLSGDGRLIVTSGSDKTLKIWDAQSQVLRGTIALHEGPATSLTVRNNRAATSHADGSVVIYDLDSQRRLYRFKRNDASVWAAAFAGSEDRIAAAGHDWAVAVWETASEAAPATVLEGHESAVQALATDASGRWLASGGADKSVKLWNLERGESRRTFRNHSDFVSALAFAPEGGTLAAGSLDGSIKLWSVSSGRVQRTIAAHTARVTNIAFSANTDLMASAAEDGTVRVRGLKRTRLYWSLSGFERSAKALVFTNDGRTLLTGGQDGVVRYWSLPEPQLAQQN